ncbi:hypothetical protein J1605_013865 [Eschrichtius robustus]|uniref:Uncharacterized protein n=1 Tax=Eschrichtius robustus TaxID=9764 RepID=A0AB34GFC7_ESCRO|nr:hypothetical protein J1605_013865 [Eschrichtius robustus]
MSSGFVSFLNKPEFVPGDPHVLLFTFSYAQAPDVQAQQLWLTGPVAPRHVESYQTRARTRVPCIGRQILNHCATREAPFSLF